MNLLPSWGFIKGFLETREVDSILYFCKFVIAVSEGDTVEPRQSSAKHVAFYREIVVRLIRAGELRSDALEQFDHVYPSDCSHTGSLIPKRMPVAPNIATRYS